MMTEKKKIEILNDAGIHRDYSMYEIEETEDSYKVYSLFGDILGCVLCGVEFKDINADGHKDVTNSKNTVNALYSLLPDEGLYVNVVKDF